MDINLDTNMYVYLADCLADRSHQRPRVQSAGRPGVVSHELWRAYAHSVAFRSAEY